MKTLIAMAAALAGAVFFVSAHMASASIEPTATTPVLQSNAAAKADRLDVPASAKGDRLVVAYRTGPGTSVAVMF